MTYYDYCAGFDLLETNRHLQNVPHTYSGNKNQSIPGPNYFAIKITDSTTPTWSFLASIFLQRAYLSFF